MPFRVSFFPRRLLLIGALLLSPLILPAGATPEDPRDSSREEQEKKELPFKKWELQFTLGIARVSPGQLYYRYEGINRLELEYTAYYDISATSSGVFKQNKLMLPLHAMLHYRLNERFFLEGGVEYAFNRGNGARSFRNQWPSLVETHDYSVSHNLTYVMPRIGFGWQFHPQFQAYAAAGLGLTSLRFEENFTLKAGNAADLNRKCRYTASAVAPALILGGCYHMDLKTRLITSRPRLLARLEFLLFSPSSFDGDREITTSAGLEKTSGALYEMEWDPFGSGNPFSYWEMFAQQPNGPEFKHVKPLRIDMSAIRLLIGVAF